MKPFQASPTLLRQPFLESQTFSSGRSSRPSRPARKHPFVWAFVTTLNLFVAVAVWAGVATVLKQPETPFCYELLGKLGKRPELLVFDAGSAPAADRLSAGELVQRFGSFNDFQLEALNQELLRGYVTNYEDVRSSDAVPMVIGEFEFVGARPLRKTDMIESGLVLLARSIEQGGGDVLLEYLLPTPEGVTTNLESLGLTPGSGAEIPPLHLAPSDQLATVTHVEKLPQGDLLFSVVPLSYQSPTFADGRTLALAPPSALNIERSLPALDPAEIGSEEGTPAVAAAH